MLSVRYGVREARGRRCGRRVTHSRARARLNSTCSASRRWAPQTRGNPGWVPMPHAFYTPSWDGFCLFLRFKMCCNAEMMTAEIRRGSAGSACPGPFPRSGCSRPSRTHPGETRVRVQRDGAGVPDDVCSGTPSAELLLPQLQFCSAPVFSPSPSPPLVREGVAARRRARGV